MKRIFSVLPECIPGADACARLWRNIARAAFQNFQQSLLHAFGLRRRVDTHVVRLATDLVDLVYVNNPDLSALHIVNRPF